MSKHSAREKEDSRHLLDVLESINREVKIPVRGTELVLLEVDPHRALACWNIDPSRAQAGRPLVLRVYDISGIAEGDPPWQTFDVEVQGLQGRWYLDFWRDERTFVSEIGYRHHDGSLECLARSNEVRTPAAGPDQTHHGRGENPPPNKTPAVVEPLNILEPESAGPAPLPKEAPLVREFPSPESLRSVLPENQEAIEAFYESLDSFPPPAAEAVPESPPEQDAAASGAPALPPLEQIVGLSSLASGGRDVLLEVNAELHIYGRGKPDTELSLYGQVVKTRPDGTFSVRRILPHGAVILPLLYTKKKD